MRNRSKELVELLGDVDKIRAERRKAKANKSKYTGTGNDALSFTSGGSRYGGFGSDSLGYGGGSSSYGGSYGGDYSGRGTLLYSVLAQMGTDQKQTTGTIPVEAVASEILRPGRRLKNMTLETMMFKCRLAQCTRSQLRRRSVTRLSE